MNSKLYRLLVRRTYLKQIRRSSSSNSSQSHYEVLNLPRTCSYKEIKQSFIKLSKQNHPDLNHCPKAHSRFLQIKEAYNILSKPHLRRNYDLGLRNNEACSKNCTNVYYESGKSPWSDPTFYTNRDKSQDKYYADKPYYGIKGVEKVSNGTIAFICISIAFIIFALQICAIRYSFTFNRERLLKRSEDASEALESVRKEAAKNGNEVQIELLKLKLAANNKK